MQREKQSRIKVRDNKILRILYGIILILKEYIIYGKITVVYVLFFANLIYDYKHKSLCLVLLKKYKDIKFQSDLIFATIFFSILQERKNFNKHILSSS